jgi:hypothetical protein
VCLAFNILGALFIVLASHWAWGNQCICPHACYYWVCSQIYCATRNE